MTERIRGALITLRPADKQKVNEFLPISDKQAIIIINDADLERTGILIDKVTILLNKYPHFGKETSQTNV